MFNFSFDKRFLYIIIGISIVLGIMSMSKLEIISLLLTLPGVIVAITFHEFAHAYAAYKLGDDTPRMQGRLNLNPTSHLDPVGFVLLIFAHVGWGKPVQINPRNFDRKYSMSAGEAIVSVAGPAMNFILAILFTVIYFAVYKMAPTFLATEIGFYVMLMIQSAAVVNVGLGIFNLIPLPPLDGSKIFRNFMSYNVKEWLDRYEKYFYIAFLILWITGLAGQLISPIISWITSGLFKLIGLLFGIPMV
ncbi:MAG: site-2 protease family protein [Clostridia bacterium]|nr:site-2 protease family protein [Clostridia bacterium]